MTAMTAAAALGVSLFSSPAQAAAYAAHRPRYPAALFEILLQACGEHRGLAVDVACGSGQAASALASAFTRVLALDGSEEQLRHADRSHANISYRQADAHDTGVPPGSADLVVVAQALHWFDIPRFYAEARRVLRPRSGVLAMWTYALPVLVSEDHAANAALRRLYEGALGPYWSERRHLVESGLRGVEPAQRDGFGVVERRELRDETRQVVDYVCGYVSSWSAYATFKAQCPDAPDPVARFRQELLDALGTTDGTTLLPVIKPLALILATDPQPLP